MEKTKPTPKEASENHDNGSVGSKTSTSENRKPKTKLTKKMLLKELSAVKSELASIRAEKEQCIQSLDTSTTENDSINFRNSEDSEFRQPPSAGNESLMATMSNMSLGTLNIPECKPSDGESDVDKKAYEHWKDILNASFNLVRATDERAKMDIFRIKAGSKLLEMMQGTSSTADMPDERIYPFSNAIARLDHYFGSRTYIIGQRSRLMNTAQHNGESNISFVRRVAAAAKLCNYNKDEEMEAMVRTIVKGTIDSRVRVLAQRNWVNQGDMSSLIAMVRDREMEIFNEEEYRKLNRLSSATIAAVTEPMVHRGSIRRNTGSRFRAFQRGRGTYRQGQTQNPGTSRSACWRCASMYHDPSVCPNLDKVCHNCKRRGHLARTCGNLPKLLVGQKRTSEEPVEDEPRPKIAAIKQNGEENDDKVMDDVDRE